jgi:hypothetical protein
MMLSSRSHGVPELFRQTSAISDLKKTEMSTQEELQFRLMLMILESRRASTVDLVSPSSAVEVTADDCLPSLASMMLTESINRASHPKLDRSMSEPFGNSQNANLKKSVNPIRYKTELCRQFDENGFCRYGDKCQFAHGGFELRSLDRHPKFKSEMCRTFHTTGFCPYGHRCHFIHNEDERMPAEQAVSPTPIGSSRKHEFGRSVSAFYCSLGSTAESPFESSSPSPTSSPPLGLMLKGRPILSRSTSLATQQETSFESGSLFDLFGNGGIM